MNKAAELKKELKKLANPKYAEVAERFFKTGKGEYGEGDVFLGIKAQPVKDLAKNYYDLNLKDLKSLLLDRFHECRMCSLHILVYKYQKGDKADKEKIFNFYLKNTKHINNWDLVDVTCPGIVGDFLLNKSRKILYKLIKSKNLWERRIAIISTFTFIRYNDFKDTIKISKILIDDNHDLIHKAVGWMLREVGKRDEKELIKFLDKYYKKMPRVALRYSIEKLEERKRKYYLNKK